MIASCISSIFTPPLPLPMIKGPFRKKVIQFQEKYTIDVNDVMKLDEMVPEGLSKTGYHL